MSHRIVSAFIGIVLALFGLSGLLFAVGVTPPPGAGGQGGTTDLPSTHRTFDAASCATCHPDGSGGSRLPGGP